MEYGDIVKFRRNEYDVTSNVNTTDPKAVGDEVSAIYSDLYQGAPALTLAQAFEDLARLYRGEFPGYHKCDTAYHDVQHVLEVTLAMARLVSGYERSRIGAPPISEGLFRLGVITALFHDMGYVRKLADRAHRNGAEYTLTHVTRGSHFLKHYLPKIGMAGEAAIAAELIHFTGFEKAAGKINVPSPVYRLIGNMLGSADIIAQMADRCYLEKCRDRLYPEFVAGGVAVQRTPAGENKVIFASGLDLVTKTPGFFKSADRRLNDDLGGSHAYVQRHFGGQNLYLEELNKNIRFAQALSENDDPASLLNRAPPDTLK